MATSQLWRGFITRKKTDIIRAEEHIFIGMAPPPPLPKEKDPLVREADVKKRRKLIQAQHEEEYRAALETLDRQVVTARSPRGCNVVTA